MRDDGSRKRAWHLNAEVYVFATLVFISFFALLFSTRNFVVNFKDMSLSVFSGVRGGVYSVTSLMRDAVFSFQELLDLRREYTELRDRMTRYEQLERSAAEILQENYRLREQLGFSQTLQYRHIPAEIIGHDADNLFSAFVINKGSREGVENDMPVIAYQNGMQALTGKVVETGRLESLVMPVYDVSFFASARLARSRYEGIVEGQGGGALPLLMRFVPKWARDEIKNGDIVATSGVGGVYPDGLTIGRVSKMFYQEDATSIEVELSAAIDFSKLEYVFVLAPEPGAANSSNGGRDD